MSLVGVLCWAAPAAADLVFFTSGRTMSVRSHRVEGDTIVLALRAGGEVLLERTLVDRIVPDEVPYPTAGPSDIRPAVRGVRAERFATLIEAVAAEEGLDPQLVHAVIRVESDYQERARSPKGAMGLMQLMPDTAREYGVTDPYNPVDNVRGGVRHLRSLLKRFDVSLALAAYNAGTAAVERYGGIPPYRETRDYVRRVLSLWPGRLVP